MGDTLRPKATAQSGKKETEQSRNPVNHANWIFKNNTKKTSSSKMQVFITNFMKYKCHCC